MARERSELLSPNSSTFSDPFDADRRLPIDKKEVLVHPDFTISNAGRMFYWEHLGMLDRADYSREWRKRVAGYKERGLLSSLVTMDDLGGVRQQRLQQVIADLVSDNLRGDTGGSEFSLQHHKLG